jgi:tRNA/tmRNA/rRNA uracil-C5-methylase (TrmA/RlmC/RlmD family)
MNVANAGITNVEIAQWPVGKFLESISGPVDFVLLDPPRFGTEKRTVLDLIALRPKVVSYVSCDASVLARDFARFLDEGTSSNRLRRSISSRRRIMSRPMRQSWR